MSAQNWYPHFSTDFVHGVMGLGAAEIGAYIIILDLIYDRGGPIPSDARWIGGILGEHARRARALIQHLVDADKLIEENGQLDNKRAKRQREDEQKAAKRSTEVGKKAASFRWRGKENQTLSNAERIPSRARVPEPDTREDSSPNGETAKRGTRLDPNWQLPLDDEAWALEQGLTREVVHRTALKFKNYWLSKSGKDAIKLDWSRTWQNWVLSDLERKPNGTGPPHTKPPTGSAKLTALMDQPLSETYDRSRSEARPQTAVRAIRDR